MLKHNDLEGGTQGSNLQQQEQGKEKERGKEKEQEQKQKQVKQEKHRFCLFPNHGEENSENNEDNNITHERARLEKSFRFLVSELAGSKFHSVSQPHFTVEDVNQLVFSKNTMMEIGSSSELGRALDPHWLFIIEALLWKDKIAMARVVLWSVGHLYRSSTAKDYHRWSEQSRLWVEGTVDDLKGRHLVFAIGQLFDLVSVLLSLLRLENNGASKNSVDHIDATMQKLAKARKSAMSSGGIGELIPLFLHGVNDPQFVTTLNRDAFSLPVAGGQLIDLRTGATRQRELDDRWTMECPVQYNPHADLSLITRWLSDLFLNRAEMVAFLQRILGYALTGLVDEQRLFIMYGDGSAGKTTLSNMLKSVLGEFFAGVPSSMIATQGRPSSSSSSGGGAAATPGPDPFLAHLVHKRVALCSETDSEAELKVSRVKQLTGNDQMDYRLLYDNQVRSLCPTHKLFVLTNHKPSVKDDDHSIWRRLCIIGFPARFVENPKQPHERKLTGNLTDSCECKTIERPCCAGWSKVPYRTWPLNRMG